jgi:hypothetical protein
MNQHMNWTAGASLTSLRASTKNVAINVLKRTDAIHLYDKFTRRGITLKMIYYYPPTQRWGKCVGEMADF